MSFTISNTVGFQDSEGNVRTLSTELGKHVYKIELTRWSITQGLPSGPKPYAASAYNTANNNITGINNALAWAYTNGYNYVVLPRGQYSICYNPNNIITSQPNMTIDFNFSTLKVMYDSDNRSPYDSTTNPIYQFGGDSIHVTTADTHIKNLILIGDRIERSWANSSEAGYDVGTTGIKVSSGADRSTIRNCNISYYMGDGIGLYYSPYNNYPGFTIEAGSIDSSSGSAIAAVSSTSVRTPSFIAITPNTTSFGMVGLGYAPQTTIPSKTYNAYFYDSTGKFIYSTQRIRTRDTVQIPKGATQMKLSWEGYINSSTGTVDLLGGSSVNTTPYWVLLITSGLADGVHVEFNQIHRCHRGGLFLGTNNAVIRKNYFHDTGMDGSTDIDGLPTFPYSTRYCIDTEDNVGQNCSIIDNVFANSRMAICLRGNYNEVSGNEFRHNTYGIELYKLDNVTIDRNYFYDSSLQCYAYDGYDRNWMITSNIFDGSSVNFAGKAGTLAVFNNNGFRNSSTFTSSVRILSYKHNVFNSSTHNISDKNTIIDNCMFINGSYIQATSVTWSIDNIIRCNFINSYVSMNATKNVTVRDSNFVNSGFLYNVNCSSFTAINCTFNNTSQPVVRSYTSLPNSIGLVTTYSLDLENCTLNLGVVPNAFVGSRSYNVGDIVTPTVYNGYYYVCTTTGIAGSTEPTWSTTVGATVQSGAAVFTVYQISSIPVIYGYGWGGLILNNCTLTLYNYTTYNNALLGYYGNLNGTLQITNTSITSVGSSATNSASSVSALKIDSKSAFTNFTNTNISVEVQSDMMTNAPTVGTFTLGQTIANKNPQSGQYLGWVCTTAGTASNVTWASGTSYTVNKVVNVGGNVYQCTVAGGSTSTSQPTGTSTVATSYPDGYSWVYVNPLAVFKTYGIIS